MNPKRREPGRIELTEEEFEALVRRLRENLLTTDDRLQIEQWLNALLWMGGELEARKLSIRRLQRLFGCQSEGISKIFPQAVAAIEESSRTEPTQETKQEGPTAQEPAPPKGHGRLGAKDFPGARCFFHPHEKLKSGERCPQCQRGNLYAIEPGTVLRIHGTAPFEAEIHAPEKLRCSTCGTVFTANLPDKLNLDKGRADPRAHALVALLRYGSGMPMYRLEGLQKALGVPLPASTQWDMIEDLANRLYPAYRALLKLSATAVQYHNDDTGVKILELKKQIAEEGSERTGIYTTGVLAKLGPENDGHDISLFFSGNRHAGENLGQVLACRPEELPKPRLMCDALSRNEPDGVSMEVAFCLDHARRQFVDLAVQFPQACRYFLERLGDVYFFDTQTRTMPDEERLKFHQKNSQPIMDELREWARSQLEKKMVEPNSALGGALKYFLNHYEKLTGFCRVAGAPLSNAIVERLLKRAILHRKNSLFYKTQAGAWVGDVLMSLIETARLSGINVLDYLTVLYERSEALRRHPMAFLPWNYGEQAIKKSQAA